MALRLKNTSAQYLIADRAPLTTYPITMAFWSIPTFSVPANGVALSIGASGSNAMWSLGYDLTPEWWIMADDAPGGARDELDISSGIVANKAQFVLGRFVSAANRWLHILNVDGTVLSAQSTVSKTTVGVDQCTIGTYGSGSVPQNPGADCFDGDLAEMWIADADFGLPGSALDAAFIHLIARDGPFGVGDQVSDSVVWQMPLRADGNINDHYVRNGPRPVWTAVSAPQIVEDIQAGTMSAEHDDATAIGTV